MNFKIKSLIVLLIISVFLLSSCEVYNTLYGTQTAPTGNTVNEPQAAQQNQDDSGKDMSTPNEINESYPGENETMSNKSVEAPTNEVTETQTQEMPKEETPTQEMPQTQNQNEQIVPSTEQNMPTQEATGEKPVVIIVQEGDLVNLVPKAEDPDKDTSLSFSFTSPLNENGEWQTTYGDNGQYTITVTASDGELATTKDVLLIVKKKEEAPTIDASKPIESALNIEETESIDFSVKASDLNKDTLTYKWKLDGVEVGDQPDYVYKTTYDDAGTHTVKIDVSDGNSEASKLWSVNVKNVNRKPILDQLNDITAKETDKIVITAVASDPDKDTVTYSISDNRFKQVDNVFTWQTDYDSAGAYKITVSASDGQDTTSQAITLNVANVNRPPVITDIIQK